MKKERNKKFATGWIVSNYESISQEDREGFTTRYSKMPEVEYAQYIVECEFTNPRNNTESEE